MSRNARTGWRPFGIVPGPVRRPVGKVLRRLGRSLWKTAPQLLPTPDREERLLAPIDRTAPGLEIGASHRPVAPKRSGFDVKILDHLGTEELRAKYASHGLDVEAIEPVDYVWKGEPLDELIEGERFAWIIASHVVEHSPDLIGFLQGCERVLRPEGVISLAVPDKRFCFDVLREASSLGQVIDAHLLRRTVHSPGALADYFMNVARLDDQVAWSPDSSGSLRFGHTVQDARDYYPLAQTGHYIDLHAWCFTPSSFRLLMVDLNLLDFTGLVETCWAGTEGHEFFIALTKGEASDTSRMPLQMSKLEEMASAARYAPRNARR